VTRQPYISGDYFDQIKGSKESQTDANIMFTFKRFGDRSTSASGEVQEQVQLEKDIDEFKKNCNL